MRSLLKEIAMTPSPSRRLPVALVADDDAIIRMFAREVLEQAGWTVDEAENGRGALAAFRRCSPDVVLLDVIMPDLDGFMACAGIRALPEGRHTPILIMTGLEDFDSITKAYDAGATDFIVKPLNPILLMHRIRYMLRAKEAFEELRANQVKLAQARDSALEGARIKSEFLATLSHEIRTPLNGVLGMTELMLDTELTQEQRHCAELIRTCGTSLLRMVTEILDFSKIESGRITLETSNFRLEPLIDRVIGLFQERAQRKGLALSFTCAANLPTELRGDPGRLQQILSNLLGNAIKFTDQGTVTLHVAIDELPSPAQWIHDLSNPPLSRPWAMLKFSIADTGIGIDPAAYKTLFLPFVQADGSTTRKYGGTGLGLAISKQLVELMGGYIGVESILGKGSIFSFSIPVSTPSVQQAVQTSA
jgi:signal transduction histidine kinase